MKIVVKSPRTEMFYTSITSKMVGFFEALAEELNYTIPAVDEQLSQFASISARAVPESGEFDFELAMPSDTSQQIRAKFMKYIDTSCYGNVETAMRRIVQLDLPLTPREQQPGKLPETADPNS